jgi:hypothetical protein
MASLSYNAAKAIARHLYVDDVLPVPHDRTRRDWRKLVSSKMARALSDVTREYQTLVGCPRHVGYALTEDHNICLKCAHARVEINRDMDQLVDSLEQLCTDGIIYHDYDLLSGDDVTGVQTYYYPSRAIEYINPLMELSATIVEKYQAAGISGGPPRIENFSLPFQRMSEYLAHKSMKYHGPTDLLIALCE